jgi:hypothetical protein
MKGNTMKQRITTLPCCLCARLLEQRADKNGKPYFVCEPCGTQFFIRGATGRERLEAILRNTPDPKNPKTKSSRSRAIDEAEIRHDLKQLQTYIESFCGDQMVIPEPPFEVGNAVSFPTWSGEVFDRVRKVIDSRVNA